MVVHDKPSIVALNEEMLDQFGCEPVGFESSTVALKALAENPDRFDLVLSYETMRELSGTGLALEIGRVRADIQIVSSGAMLTVASQRLTAGRARPVSCATPCRAAT